jgi:hypothetical protein
MNNQKINKNYSETTCIGRGYVLRMNDVILRVIMLTVIMVVAVLLIIIMANSITMSGIILSGIMLWVIILGNILQNGDCHFWVRVN